MTLAAMPPLSREQQTADTLGGQNVLREHDRAMINQYYQDPARQQEMNRRVSAGIEQAMAGLNQQLYQRALQEKFQRAGTGNVGGSLQAGQQAGIQNAGALGALQISQQGLAQRDAMQQGLDAQQQNELLQTFGMDPFVQQMINERLSGLGVENAGNAAMFGLDQQRMQQEQFANDELSRGLGNIFNQAGQYYTIDQRAQMLGRRGLFG